MSAQSGTNKTPQDPFVAPRAKQQEFLDKIPDSLKRDATPEARAAWEKLTTKQQELVKTKVNEIFDEATTKVMEARRNNARNVKPQNWKQILQSNQADAVAKGTATQSTVRFSDRSGSRRSLVTATERESVVAPQRPIDPCIDDPTLCDPGNQPPQVSITATPTSGAAPLVVNFTANAYDPDGYITSYSWNFGDGQTATGASVSHTYQTAGNFTASVIVTDDFGNSAGASVVISTNGTPGQGTDADNDGLPESFENAVADAFTPVYYVSAYEPDQLFDLCSKHHNADCANQLWSESG